MTLDQFLLDRFPPPPVHGQLRAIEVYDLAFPSKSERNIDNRTLTHLPRKMLSPLLPKLDHLAERQRLIRRAAIPVSSPKEHKRSFFSFENRKIAVSGSVSLSDSDKCESFAQNSALVNLGPAQTVLSPPSLPPDKPLSAVPLYPFRPPHPPSKTPPIPPEASGPMLT
ncbi:hypothetical protein L218DRAFT_954114 [Marasmius fiardii PR-910]|nr:hypothetical protein L218DRAFT_954114 [Marasmius fiardii PR-910]